MSSQTESKSNVGKVVAGVAAAALVGGAVWWYLKGRNGSSEDADAQISVKKASGTTSSSSSSSSGATAAKATFASARGKEAADAPDMGVSAATTSMFDAEDRANGMFATGPSSGSGLGGNELRRENSDAIVMPGQADAKGRVNFPALRVWLQLAPGWSVSEEPQLPTPTAAMVQMQHKRFEHVDIHEVPPGEVPIVVLMVEDLGSEGVDATTFATKGKQMLEQQLRMMCQGMLQPRCLKDASASVGPFTHVLEYELRSGFMGVHAICYSTVQNGMGYQFQIFLKPELMAEFRPDFFSMASNFQITPEPASDNFDRESFLWMPLRSKQNDNVSGVFSMDGDDPRDAVDGSFKMPPGWLIAKEQCRIPNAIIKKETILCAIQTPSVSKPEVCVITNVKPRTDADGIDVIKADADYDGVTMTEVRVGAAGKHIKIFESPCGQFWLATGPTAKHNQVIHNELFANIAASVQLGSKPPTKTGVRYMSYKYGVAFDVRPGGKILETRLEKQVIMYAPLGQHEINPMEPPSMEVMQKIRESPTVQIRVGDPASDEDCQKDLAEWKKSVEKQAKQTHLKNIRIESRNGREFLMFESAEMVEVGMGRSEERTARMFVTMNGIRSCLVRWEAPSEIVLKHTNLINAMVDSIDVFEPTVAEPEGASAEEEMAAALDRFKSSN